MWLSIIWALLPKRYVAGLVIKGLKHLAQKTDNGLDDKIVGIIENLLEQAPTLTPFEAKS